MGTEASPRSNIWRQNPPLVCFLLLLLLLAWPLMRLQDHREEQLRNVTAGDAIRYLPSGKFLTSAVLGFRNLTADLLWVRGISLFGEQYRKAEDDQWFQWLFQLVDLATELDPRDHRIYKYGGIMLRLAPGHVDQSTYILHKGLRWCPKEYFLPFGIAMNYLESKNSPEKAAEYMQLAAKTPNAPFYLSNLAASILNRTDKGEAALLFLEEELERLKPGSLQYIAAKVKVSDVKHQIAVRQLLLAMREYMSRYNRPPATLEEMQGVTWSGPWPEDPFGGHFILDPATGRIMSSEYKRVKREVREKYGLGLDENQPK